MDLLAHFVMGLVIAKKLNNPWAVLLSCLIDIDHIIGYIYDRRKKKFLFMPSLLHIAYRPRTWLHSITGAALFAAFFIYVLHLPFDVVFFSFYIHLAIDMLDKTGIYVLPPLIKRKVKGALPVGYLMEDSGYLQRHKRSHIPSILLILIVAVLVLLKLI